MKIAAAAIRYGTEIYTGRTHFEAVRKILTLDHLTNDQKVAVQLDGEDGFVTDDGRFVNREEAFEIASREKQMIQHELANNPAANMEFYGGSEPRLDSGLIESYAPLLGKKSYII